MQNDLSFLILRAWLVLEPGADRPLASWIRLRRSSTALRSLAVGPTFCCMMLRMTPPRSSPLASQWAAIAGWWESTLRPASLLIRSRFSVWNRDTPTRILEPVQVFAGWGAGDPPEETLLGVEGNKSVTISADGRHVYLASGEASTVFVFSRDADSLAALRVDVGNDLLVDGSGEHHFHDFHRVPVGDPQPTLKF